MGPGGLRELAIDMRPALVRMLRVRGASGEEANDIVQDLFVKLETMRTGPVSEARAFLYRVVDNLWLDRRRSEARRAVREQRWTEECGSERPPSTEQALTDRQRLAIVSAAIAKLPPRTVEIFRRFRLDDEDQRGIAASLGISLSAVEKHLQRAYRAIAEARAVADAGLPDGRRLNREER